MLADGEIHPAFIQKSAHHKRWQSSVTYIEASLRKALKANDLLLGNDPSEGWGSQYSGNPKSLSRFLPERFIKQLPPQAEISLVITTGAATAPAPSDPNLNLAALDALQKSGAIEVIYPRSWQGNLVNSHPSPSKYSKN